jgi:hypothetical protein
VLEAIINILRVCGQSWSAADLECSCCVLHAQGQPSLCRPALLAAAFP